jgi:large subunit ribosomal protein L29
MNNKDIKQLSLADLEIELTNAELSSQDLRYNHSVAVLENTQILKNARKTVARIKTELRSRELQNSTDLQRDKILSRRKKERKK